MRRSAVLALWVCGVWACAQPARTVGGTVTGLDSGKTVRLKLGSQSLSLIANGSFVFTTPLDEGAPYAVAVQTQPTSQVCTVANGTGTMGKVAISNVEVDCVDVNPSLSFPVRVQVSGLSGTLKVVNNNSDPLTITTNGVYPFATQIAGGAPYFVTVASQPTGQVCVLSSAAGNVTNAAVTVPVVCGPAYLVAGTVTYDDVPVVDSASTGAPYLDYTNITSRPVRRALVQAVRSTDGVTTDGTVLSESRTKDDGTYTLPVPQGTTVLIWVRAESRVSGYLPDGIGQEHCNGATWDVAVVDNTDADAAYVLQSNNAYSSDASGADLRATLYHGTNGYTLPDGKGDGRSSAPFALLDTAVSEMELVCEGSASYTLPLLYIGWSPKNTSESGSDPSTGAIGTSFFTADPNDPSLSRLYILGKQNIDTDEFDDHVVAHEFGHFVEYRLYRSDSVGGDHGAGDVLMPSVAFSEGYGNSVSGMVFNDPIYRDTYGTGQSDGFDVNVSEAPTGNDQGIYSEGSVQYLLWSLYEARDGVPNSGSYDRLFTVLHDDQASTPALTSAVSFAAAYRYRNGDTAEGLQTLWVNGLDTPWDAICVGTCASNGAADPFDTDNDVGAYYQPRRLYPATGATAAKQSAEFWRMYRMLSHGSNAPTAHDVIVSDGGSDPNNKWGYVRAYVISGTGGAITLTAQISGTQPSTCNSAGDEMDAFVLQNGTVVAGDDSTDACPTLSITSQASTPYVWLVLGIDQPVSSITPILQ